MEKEELWQVNPEFPTYHISSMGRIKTFNWKGFGLERVMKPAKDANGYMRTMLVDKHGKIKTIKVHRVVAQTFLPNPLNKPQVNHINFDRADNRISNLEWNTVKENFRHTFDNDRYVRLSGSKNGFAKLNEEKVLEIRLKYKPFIYTRKMLAEEYGVDVTCIKDVVGGKSWTHI